ncbi:unnamed protein product, partial [Rotaria magnacalcarata]
MTDEKISESATTATKSDKQHINMFSRGDLLFWKCEYEKAKKHFQMILISPPISLLDSARCYSSLGAVNTELKNYEEAIYNYHKQLDLLIKLKIPNKTEGDIAKCLMSIGMVYFLQLDYVQALSYQKQALDTLAIVTPAHDLTSKIYRNIANLYAKTKEFDSALKYFQEALALNDRDLEDNGLTLGQIYADIGVMYYSKEDYKRALYYFTKAHATWLKSLRPGQLYVKSMEKTIRTVESKLINIPANAKWSQNGVTIAGGNGQLYYPHGLVVDDDQTVVIADTENNRIMQWKNGDTTNGQVVAGGKGAGNEFNQLNQPTDVLIDKETDSLIICDQGNQRIVRWSRRSGTTQGEMLIDNIRCWGLAMDEQRYLYVSDWKKSEVRRYQLGEKNGTLVAGGNGDGGELSQLNFPAYLFVDWQQNVYISDRNNHRVMKWDKGAKEGIVVAG